MAESPSTESNHQQRRVYSVVVWSLRVAVALQAIGAGKKLLGFGSIWEVDSAVFGLLLYDWHWSEDVAQRVDDWGAWCYFLCGVALVVLPVLGVVARRLVGKNEIRPPAWLWQAPLCLIVSLWQAVLTTAEWHRGGFFMSEWALVSEAARFALPFVLLVLTPLPSRAEVSPLRMAIGIWLLRIAAAMTFVGHGLKAYYLNPRFLEFLQATAEHISWEVSQSTAEAVLRTIGVVDFVVAALILLFRWRAVALYMAVWALIAAFARVVHSGWDSHFEVLVRAGNYCVPLVVALFWQLSRQKQMPTAESREEKSNAESR